MSFEKGNEIINFEVIYQICPKGNALNWMKDGKNFGLTPKDEIYKMFPGVTKYKVILSKRSTKKLH